MRKERGMGDVKEHEDLGNEELQSQGRCKVAIIRETGKNEHREHWAEKTLAPTAA